MRPFMAYAMNDPKDNSALSLNDLSVSYTAKILARFGFIWPACGEDYYQLFLNALNGLNY